MIKKYDGNILSTIKDNPKITFEEFAKIYDKSTIDNQFTSMVRCGMIKISNGELEVKN